MNPIYLTYGPCITPLGNTLDEFRQALLSNETGVKKQIGSGYNQEDWYLGKMSQLPESRYSALLESALLQLKEQEGDKTQNSDSLFIISTTKGELNALPEDTFTSTYSSILKITGNPNQPVIISNACISGVLAINAANDYLKAGMYNRVYIVGIDALYDFIVFGFQSLFALGDKPCKPFDADRNGINIGEGCGILIATNEKPSAFAVKHLGGSSSNDANHISGPSRTGEGLVRSVSKTLLRCAIQAEDIDYISAHGTATLFNDEMESIAFDRLQMQDIPLNSYKGYFGHTLGAAGVLETIASMISMEEQLLFESLGYSKQGTSMALNIIESNQPASIKTILKTASGFGGGNASLIITTAQ